MSKRLLQFTTLLVLCLWLVGTVAANSTIPASQDATLDYANPTQTNNGSALAVGYSNFLSIYQPTTQAILQFDVSSADVVNRAALRLNVSQNFLQVDGATLAVYALDSDQWSQASVHFDNAPQASGAPLATLTLDGSEFGQIELGTTAGASALSQHIEAQRTGDGTVSLLVRLDSVTNGDLAGMAGFESMDGFDAPVLVISAEAVPTAVNLSNMQLTSTQIWLPLLLIGLITLTLLGARASLPAAMWRPRWSRSRTRWLSVFIILGMMPSGVSIFKPLPPVYGSECQTPVRPANFTIEMSAGAYMHWDDNPANDGGYVVWRGTNTAYPDTTQPPHATLDAGFASFYETESMTEVEWTYVVAGRNSCGDLSSPTEPVGVKQFALDGTHWQPISVPFTGGAFPITDAQSFMNNIFGADALAKWNAERQVFTVYGMNGGDNFPIAAGDTIFVLPQEWTESIAVAGHIERVDYMLETGGISFFTIPLHRSDITTAMDLFLKIDGAELLYLWDGSQFVPFDGTGADVAIDPTQPVGIKLAENPDRAVQQWPGDAAQMVWSERNNQGSREIYLRWYDGTLDVGNKYSVYRRALTEVEWTYIGGTAFAKDQAMFEGLVSADLRQSLATDLNVTINDLYTFLQNNLDIAQLHADQHSELAIALGTAFVDTNIDFVEWTYKVEVERSGESAELLQQSCIPAPPNARAEWTYTPLDIAENNIADVPAGLGIAPSNRDFDVAERHNWDGAQQFRQMDGRVFLDWNSPQLPAPSFSPDPVCATNGDEQIAGYRIYRRSEQTGETWELANQTSTGSTPILARISGDDFHFEDAVKTIYGDDAYGKWDYQVCAVDYLGQEVHCEERLDLPVRELDSPSQISDLTATMDDKHLVLQVEWTYSDLDEVHTPVQFVVSRATEHAATEWEDVATTSGTSVTIDKQAQDESVMYWYRVQVRDDAGNWSAPSAPVHATFYPRTAPPFDLGLDNSDCVANEMPLQLNGLDGRIVQVAMYRGFSADGPFQIIDRFRVEAGSVLIEEDVTPPSSVVAWYMLEAFDAHGNPSAPQLYCAGLPGENPLPEPRVEILWPQTKADPVRVTGEGGDDVPDDTTFTVISGGVDGAVIEVVQLDENGAFVWPESAAESVASGLPVQVTATQTDALGQPSEPASFTFDPNQSNNGAYVEWTYSELGDMFHVQWDLAADKPTAIVEVTNYPCFNCVEYPYLVLYRKVSGGMWQQVNRPIPANQAAVDGYPGWTIIDDYDLSPQHTYQYKASLLSPVTFEPLGAFDPFILFAAQPKQTLQHNAPISDVPTCEGVALTPAQANLADVIHFPHGDVIVSSYYQADGDCNIPTPPAKTDAYGIGVFSYGEENFPVTFAAIEIDDDGNLMGGRIVADTDGHIVAGNPLIEFLKIEGSPTGVRAEMQSILPDTIMLVDETDSSNRYSQINATVDLLDDNWLYSEPLVTSYYVIDENLPWQFSGDLTLDGTGLHIADNSDTTFRFEPIDSSALNAIDAVGSNLGFAQPSYKMSDVRVSADGINGTIATEVEWTYYTAQPAAFSIHFDGASLTLTDGQISEGQLLDASAGLLYFPTRRTQYGLQRSLQLYQSPILVRIGDVEAIQQNTLGIQIIEPSDDTFALGENGVLFDSADLTQATNWIKFGTEPDPGHLFLAPAISNVDPVRNGWDAITDANNRFDPGYNMQRTPANDDHSIDYSCFSGDPFNATYQLYVRRGGVSGYVEFADAGGNVRVMKGFPTQVTSFQALFRESDFVNGNMGLNVQLPYPSDFTIPADISGFTPREGCPATGVPSNDGKVKHDYWDMDQQVNSLAFINTDPILYGGGRSADLPEMMLELHGIIDMPQLQDIVDPTAFLKIDGKSQWFPNGDVGDIAIFTGGELDFPEVRVNGMYHLLTDLLPSRYFGPDGKPDVVGLAKEQILQATDLTPDALQQCSLEQVVGCGIMILDGHSAVDMFGELEDEILDEVDAWFPEGSSPVAFYRENEEDIQAFINDPEIAWEWANGSEYNEWPIPVKVMAGPDGAVVAGVFADLNLVDVVRGDFGFVVTMLWENDALVEEVGIYSGYAASQGVLRALAHYFKHDTQFPAWSPELEEAMQSWAEQFGYDIGDEGDDDPVDLAKAKWGSWSERRFVEVYSVIEGSVKPLGGEDKYGITSLQTGDVLDDLGVTLSTNLGAATIIPFGEGKVLQDLYFGTKMVIDGEGEDPFINAKWIKLEYDKDGEFRIFGDDIETTLSSDLTVSADLALIIAWADGNERIEGGVILKQFETGDVQFREMGGAFGVGQYNNDLLLYIGVRGEGRWDEYVLGGAFLVGSMYDSPVLRHAGFDEAVDKLTTGDQPLPFFGFYLNVYGEFPLYDSGALRANGTGELTLWFAEADPNIWGGQLEASVYATLAEIVSGRGTLNLVFEKLQNGQETDRVGWRGTPTQTCQSADGCTSFAGTFWVAAGVGSCEPRKWREWDRRWWRDSWCYQVGAIVGLSYIDSGSWLADYDVDWE